MGQSYVVNGSAVLCELNDLNGDVVANVEGNVRYEWYLRQAEHGARVGSVDGSSDLEGWDNGERHVGRIHFSWTVDTDVDVDVRCLVSFESRLLVTCDRFGIGKC